MSNPGAIRVILTTTTSLQEPLRQEKKRKEKKVVIKGDPICSRTASRPRFDIYLLQRDQTPESLRTAKKNIQDQDVLILATTPHLVILVILVILVV